MSTSKLQRRVSELLSIHFGQYTIRENTRPNWLITTAGARLELDFYIEELRIAIEVQGEQHYFFVPHFHRNYANFEKQCARDTFKREQCTKHDIGLFEIGGEQDALLAIDTILSCLSVPIKPDKSEFYPIPIPAQKKKKRGGGQDRYWRLNYPKTIRKNLRRLLYTLGKMESSGEATEKAGQKIDIYLRAIEQYEAVKGKVGLEAEENELLVRARVILSQQD